MRKQREKFARCGKRLGRDRKMRKEVENWRWKEGKEKLAKCRKRLERQREMRKEVEN